MLELTIKTFEGDIITAEFDRVRGMVYSHDVRACDLLLGMAFSEKLDTDLQRLMLEVMGVITIAPEDIVFHRTDAMQQEIEAVYSDEASYGEFMDYIINRNGSKPPEGWETSDDFNVLPYQYDIHFDGGDDLRFLRSEISTILVPEKNTFESWIIVINENDISQRIKEKKASHEELAVYGDNLTRADFYWCQSKPHCLSSFRGSDFAHARPWVEEPRKFINGEVRMTDIQHRLPIILSALPIEKSALKTLALAREHIPTP